MQTQTQRAPRFETDIPVSVREPASDGRRVGRVKNLSGGGLLLVDEMAPVAGGPIAIELPASLGFGRVLLLGEVVWREGGRVGVSLRGMLPHHRHRFLRLLARLGDPVPAT